MTAPDLDGPATEAANYGKSSPATTWRSLQGDSAVRDTQFQIRAGPMSGNRDMLFLSRPGRAEDCGQVPQLAEADGFEED